MVPVPSADARGPAEWGLVAAVTALLFCAVFFGGGSGDDALATLGSVAVVAAAAAVVLAALGRLALPRLDRPGRVAVLAALALTAWVGASVVWSIAGDRSWTALGKALVDLSFLVLGLVVVATLRGGAARASAASLTLVLAAAIGWALLGRAVPGLFPDGGRIARLREPVEYWNALALLCGAAVPFGLWLATTGTARLRRVGGALLVYGAVLALLLTQSRAGVLAVVAGAALWVVLTDRRLAGCLLGLGAAAPALAVGVWAFTRPALVEDGASRAARVDDGILFAVLALAGASVVALVASRWRVDALVERHPRRVRRALALAAGVVVAAGVVGLAAAVGNPVSWARDQVSGGECANTPGRLTQLCANNRPEWWQDAVEVFADHPALGSGALTFEIARKRVRDDGFPVIEPHSVPLQLLSDLGVVGLLLGLTVAAAVIAGGRRALRRLDGAERAAAAPLACLPLVYGVHALVDYDLDFLAVTAPALFACGALLGTGRPLVEVGGRAVVSLAAVATAVAALVVLVAPALAEREVERSTIALEERRLSDAEDAARRARSLDPLALEPVYAAAVAADRLGRPEAARALYRKATRMQPENPETWIVLGLYELAGRQDACAAYAALNAAWTLDPNGRQWMPGGALDQARDAVNAGACEEG